MIERLFESYDKQALVKELVNNFASCVEAMTRLNINATTQYQASTNVEASSQAIIDPNLLSQCPADSLGNNIAQCFKTFLPWFMDTCFNSPVVDRTNNDDTNAMYSIVKETAPFLILGLGMIGGAVFLANWMATPAYQAYNSSEAENDIANSYRDSQLAGADNTEVYMSEADWLFA